MPSTISSIFKSVVNNYWVVLAQDAAASFNFAKIYPTVLVNFNGYNISFSFSQLYETHKQEDKFALVFKTNTYFAIEFTTITGLKRKSYDDIFQEIIHRADCVILYRKSPVVIKSTEQTPNAFDFLNSCPTYLFYQGFNEDEQKFAGYAEVSLLDPKEAVSKGLKNGYYLVFDSEVSGGITQKLTCETIFKIYREELQISIICDFGGVSILFDSQDKFLRFKETLIHYVQYSYYAIFKPSANENRFYENMTYEDQQDSQDEDFDGGDVENVNTFSQRPMHFDANSTMAVVSLDDMIALFTDDTQTFHKLVLKDLEDRYIATKSKAGLNQRVLSTERVSAPTVVYEHDLVKNKLVSAFSDYNPVSDHTKTVMDFAAGSADNIANSTISSQFGVVGITPGGVYLMDRRYQNARTGVEFIYQQTSSFTVVHVCNCGSVVVGMKDGGVKIFNKLGNRSINNFPGMGFEITGISLDSEEKYLVLTCKSMIIVHFLVDTSGVNALLKQSKLDDRRQPVLIKISVADVVRAGAQNGLATAFVTNDGKRLISGSAKTLFVWQFYKVLAGNVKNARRIDLGSCGCGGKDMGYKGLLVGCDSGFKIIK